MSEQQRAGQPLYYRFLNRLSVRNKIVAVCLIASFFAMTLASSLFVYYQYSAFQGWLIQNLTSQAEIIARNSSAALAFDDPEGAEVILESLQAVDSITGAVLFRQDGTVLTKWQRDESGEMPELVPDWQGDRNVAGEIFISLPVVEKQMVFGSIVLRSNQQELVVFLGNSLVTMVVMLFLAVLVTLLLSTKLLGIILEPVAHLARVMKQVSGRQEYSLRALRYSNDEIGDLTDFFNDMLTQVENRDRQIREREELLQAIINNTNSVIFLKDLSGGYLMVNRRFKEVLLLKQQEVVGYMDGDLFPADIAGSLKAMDQQVMDSGLLVDAEEVLPHHDGPHTYISAKFLLFDSGGKPYALCGISTDITKRKQIEEVMMQTEKMMSVGGLAAGMAHEINNPLGIMIQAVQNIKRRVSSDLPANQNVADELGVALSGVQDYLEKRMVLSMLDDIYGAGMRAARIVANMLQFSRRSESASQYALVTDLIDQTVELAANDYDLKKKYDFRHISIIREYDPAVQEVKLVVTEFEQVILNLLKNAAQAFADKEMAEGEVPTITLRVLPDGDYTRIEVVDNGPGISPEVRKRVFEPFFTTKPVGSGTGLGLSVSYMIITNNHSGTMEVESVPGDGAVFIIRLPNSDGV